MIMKQHTLTRKSLEVIENMSADTMKTVILSDFSVVESVLERMKRLEAIYVEIDAIDSEAVLVLKTEDDEYVLANVEYSEALYVSTKIVATAALTVMLFSLDQLSNLRLFNRLALD